MLFVSTRILIDEKPIVVFRCVGARRCFCKSCKNFGRYGLHRLDRMYCLPFDFLNDTHPKLMCYQCLVEFVREFRKK